MKCLMMIFGNSCQVRIFGKLINRLDDSRLMRFEFDSLNNPSALHAETTTTIVSTTTPAPMMTPVPGTTTTRLPDEGSTTTPGDGTTTTASEGTTTQRTRHNNYMPICLEMNFLIPFPFKL